jgi:D-glycero-D-manno-heptose 1,7-bisphosphate phosphatase
VSWIGRTVGLSQQHVAICGLEMNKVRQAVFLDRDGVIVENRSDYIKTWQEVRFLPNAFKALRQLGSSGFVLVLVTNQSVVGRGIITLEEAERINAQVIAQIEAQGGRIDASYLCPHRPNEGCSCRKPEPGMLLQAAEEFGLAMAHSYVVGDAASDIEAAYATGAQGILVLTGRGREQVALLSTAGKMNCPVVADLGAAVDYILAREEGKP